MRMIERWFPCAEVSEASAKGWGTGNSEKAMFTWFAARPLAQAKAAVVASLLPWPADEGEQRRLQDLMRRSLRGRDDAHPELAAELARTYPAGARLIDPFSGRGMIPLEAARLGIRSWGIDYSPMATLAGQLLADYPLRNWSDEPPLPFDGYENNPLDRGLLQDVAYVLEEVGRRWEASMGAFYPAFNGLQPWGYLWAIALPCRECGTTFPLVGSLALRTPQPRKHDPGASYHIAIDKVSGKFWAEVHEGRPTGTPTRVVGQGKHKYDSGGRVAVCPFCDHVHPNEVLTRLTREGAATDALLLAADLHETYNKSFRRPTREEFAAVELATVALKDEPRFANELSARPDEVIPPGNTRTIQPLIYGARTYGDLCNDRQTLGFVRLCRVINEVATEILAGGASHDYAAALAAYASAGLVRKMRRSTRGVALQIYGDGRPTGVHDVFGHSESSIAFSFDYFETGLTDAAGGWRSITERTLATLRSQAGRPAGRPAVIERGSALSLPLPDRSVDAVVTDPPYDEMVEYADASDLFFVWVKRALATTHPDLTVATDAQGLQEKGDEIIVSRRTDDAEHRTREFYDKKIAEALVEARRVVKDDGVVTIVFGHGEPEVWHRLLRAITAGGLYLTGSWPAKTEKGGAAGSANIVTTLTMSCRPAPANRPIGRANDVRAAVRREVRGRVPEWDRAGLALTDQLMASAGPAMEVVGRYSEVVDAAGHIIEPYEFLALARRAVEEAAAIEIEDLPLEVFDSRTRFALFWSRLFARSVAPKSEARWQAMASDLTLEDVKGILKDADKGSRLAYAREAKVSVGPTSSVIDIAMALARAWPDGLDEVANVLAVAGRDSDDSQLFAALTYLSSRLPEADPDRQAWTGIVRSRKSVRSAVRIQTEASSRSERERDLQNLQGTLFDLQHSEQLR
jgi:putative DNA methylase